MSSDQQRPSQPSQPAQQPPAQPHMRVPCPVRRSPLFDVVPGGIEIKCRSCRAGQTHFISREWLELIWASLPAKGSGGEYPGICFQRD